MIIIPTTRPLHPPSPSTMYETELTFVSGNCPTIALGYGWRRKFRLRVVVNDVRVNSKCQIDAGVVQNWGDQFGKSLGNIVAVLVERDTQLWHSYHRREIHSLLHFLHEFASDTTEFPGGFIQLHQQRVWWPVLGEAHQFAAMQIFEFYFRIVEAGAEIECPTFGMPRIYQRQFGIIARGLAVRVVRIGVHPGFWYSLNDDHVEKSVLPKLGEHFVHSGRGICRWPDNQEPRIIKVQESDRVIISTSKKGSDGGACWVELWFLILLMSYIIGAEKC